jgi:hypothetical protein
MKDKLLLLKMIRLCLSVFMLVGIALALVGILSGAHHLLLWLVPPVTARVLYECWVNLMLKRFDDEYPPGYKLEYTDEQGNRRNATIVQVEAAGGVLLKETDESGVERVYKIPVTSLIVYNAQMKGMIPPTPPRGPAVKE